MAQVTKIDSNDTSLRIAEEDTIGVLPVTPVWKPYEPNSYSEFGGKITTVSRNPINKSRQRKKGVATDLDANGGFNTDLTQSNLQDILQGFFFADLRRKGEEEPTSVTVQAGDDTYEVASTTGIKVGDLVYASGFTNSENNGLKRVTAIVANTSVAVAETLVNEASPPSGAKLVVVGAQGGAGDIDVDASGDFATLTSTTLDFTTLGLIPGEPVYIGGDTAIMAFTNAANNGIKRVKSIVTNALVLDKSDSAMVTEASTTETIQLFFGRVLKNETDNLIVRRTYQLERQLGAPDGALPSEIQSEYVVGAVPSTVSLKIGQADKLNVDLGFVATDHELVDGPTGVKSGIRPDLDEEDAFNTSSDFYRIKVALVSSSNEAPEPLYAFAQEFEITVNNNVKPNKAVSVLGAFEVSKGTFEVGGSITAYFGNVSAVQAVRNNSDVTMDAFVAKENKGFFVDLPLISLGDGLLDVTQDEPVKLPLDMLAATGAKVDPNMDHTLLMSFFDYLPSAAEA